MATAKEMLAVSRAFILKDDNKALKIFAFDLFLYFALLVLSILVDNVLVKCILSILIGINIALLFIVGHDCCHNSFTSSPFRNRIIGIVSFLPSLHNFKLWELGHNKTHHAYTNLKSKDYVYTPLSIDEYRELSWVGRLKYRLYRSIFGHLFYYLVEIWLKKMIWPFPSIQNINNHRKYRKESILLLVYLIFILLVISMIAVYSSKPILFSILFSFIIPFLLWNWLMGFVIYQHHTSPLSKWYKDEKEWEYWECQLSESIHIKFPKPLNFILHNIMEHTAHHCDMRIPLYNLGSAQNKIESQFEGEIKIVKWDWKFYFDSIRKCKLYDYDNHKWQGFNQFK